MNLFHEMSLLFVHLSLASAKIKYVFITGGQVGLMIVVFDIKVHCMRSYQICVIMLKGYA